MKFSIRDLLLVTMIVALVVGWWLDRFRLKDECHRLNERLDAYQKERQYSDSSGAIYWKGGDTQVIVLPTSQAPAPKLPSD